MNISDALLRAREALEAMYTGVCDIYEYIYFKDPETRAVKEDVRLFLADIPCRISFKNVGSGEKTGVYTEIGQGVCLFLSPDIEVKPGSLITVTQNGETLDFELSGARALYNTHQEIGLVLKKRWA